MKPSERIGNLLYNEKGEVVEVESITKTHINEVELSKWRPIPITESILNDWLGFINNWNGFSKYGFWKGDFKIISSGQCIFYTVVNGEEIELKYLHQLQNLYYELHREDLKIKL